jgi:hypothetical protein
MEGSMKVALNDAQLKVVMVAAADMSLEKRALFLEGVSAMVNIRRRRFSDAGLIEIAAVARIGLAREPA